MYTPRNVRITALAAASLLVAAGLGVSPALAQIVDPAIPAPPTSAPPFTTPDTSDCPARLTPPPPVDPSEEPHPGQPSPDPLPVPDTPVGGILLGTCELVYPAGVSEPPSEISAASWLIADLDSGEVLAAKDPHGRHRPASTIKTLLALVALDELDRKSVV